MLMYRIYNADTLEKLINTVQDIHNVTSSHEKLFAGEHNPGIFRLLYMDALGTQLYAFKGLISLKIRTNLVSVVKLSPVYNMASSGLWKMFTFIILNHQNGVWENVYLYNIDTYDLLYDFWQMLCLRCQGRCNLPGRC